MRRNKKIKGKRPLPTFRLIIQLFDSRSISRLFPFPFLLPIIPCLISLPQLTPAPLRDLETTGDESPNFRPFAAKPSRDLLCIKLWAATLRMPEMEKACSKHQNGQV